MKQTLEGVLIREKGQPCIKADDGKTKLIYNLFDGLSNKRVRITVEEPEKQTSKD